MIKKLVYGLAIIAGLVSCNDDYTDWASPQSNDSKEPVDKIAFTVEPAVSAIDFVVETAENIQLFTTSLQDGQVSEYALTLSAEGKDKTAALSATAAGMVASTDLANAVAAIYGKSPEERTVAVEVAADVTVKTEDGSIITKKKASPFTLKVKLNTPLEYSWGAATDNVTIADKNYLSLTTTNSKDIIVPNGKYNVFFNDITGEVVFQTAE